MTDRPEQVDPDATVRATAQALLELTAAVVEQLHPHRRGGAPVGLDDSLERDLGFDSLGRVELLFRMEETFGVSLPDSLLAAAETPRDLLRAVAGAEGGVRRARTAEIERISLATGQGDPSGAETLVEVLERQVAADPERLYVSFLAEGEQTDPMSYGQLATEAERVAAGLQAFGLQPGQAVAIMLPTGREYFYSFYGALLAGGIPTPIYPPFRASQMEEHLRRHTAILANCLAPVLITLPEAHSVANWLSGQVESLRWVTTVAEVQGGGGRFARPAAGGGDIALLQYTSGSTGDPKGVVLTHRNLLANIRAMGRAIQADGSDVFVSWLPLYHDMGLIGAWLGSL
ncbi:MAG: AMP-binding protein, partial [bacterium]